MILDSYLHNRYIKGALKHALNVVNKLAQSWCVLNNTPDEYPSLNTDRIRKNSCRRRSLKQYCVQPRVLHSNGEGCSGPLQATSFKNFLLLKIILQQKESLATGSRQSECFAQQIKQVAKNCNYTQTCLKNGVHSIIKRLLAQNFFYIRCTKHAPPFWGRLYWRAVDNFTLPGVLTCTRATYARGVFCFSILSHDCCF